jgi:hypothetical protein
MLVLWLFSRAPRRALALALIGATTTGCVTTTLVPTKDATRLSDDALTFAGELRAVHDLEGNLVVLGESYDVKLVPSADLPHEWAHWGASAPAIASPLVVEVRGPLLVLQGRHDLSPTQLPLAHVKHLRVQEFSAGATAGLVVGVTLGLGLVFLAALSATSSSSH